MDIDSIIVFFSALILGGLLGRVVGALIINHINSRF